MNLFECSPAYASELIFWSAVIVAFYFVLAITRFIPEAMSAPSRKEKFAWAGLTTIFVFCGITGYGSTIVSGWYAEEAYAVKVWFMKLGAAACVLFWHLTKGHTLELGKTKEARELLADERANPLDRIEAARKLLGGDEK